MAANPEEKTGQIEGYRIRNDRQSREQPKELIKMRKKKKSGKRIYKYQMSVRNLKDLGIYQWISAGTERSTVPSRTASRVASNTALALLNWLFKPAL